MTWSCGVSSVYRMAREELQSSLEHLLASVIDELLQPEINELVSRPTSG